MNYTREQVLSCYRKFKSYIFYSKNHSYLYKSLVEFEDDFDIFNSKIDEITQQLNSNCKSYFASLISKIDAVPFIKSVEPNNKEPNNLFTNDISKVSKTCVTAINYFIKCPIELFIVDTLWALLCLSATDGDERIKYCYANYPAKDLIAHHPNSLIENINFKTLSIYEPYFEKYKSWQCTIIDKALEMKRSKQDCKLVSLDITGFFYSAKVDFDLLKLFLTERASDFYEHDFLTSIIIDLYHEYKNKLLKRCNDRIISEMPIPIGLVSSGFVSNFVLSETDIRINKCRNVILSNRYVDDILILLEGNIGKTFNQLIQTIFDGVFAINDEINKIYSISGTNLLFKNEKMRLFDIKHTCSEHTLIKLKNDIFQPSGIKLFPKYVSNFEQLYDRSVTDNKTLKIRDNIQKPNINSSKLSGSLSGFLLMKSGTEDDNYLDSKTSTSILSLLDSTIVLSTYQRWDKMFSFFISSRTKYKFKKLLSFINSSINKITVNEELKISRETLYLLKNTLRELCEISVCQSLAPYGSEKWRQEEYSNFASLSRKFRKANLFDHILVSYPLANLFIEQTERDLTVFSGDSNSTEQIDFNKKLVLFPRFIHLDEYLYLKQCSCIFQKSLSLMDYSGFINEYYTLILTHFSDKTEKITIDSVPVDGFILHKIKFPNIDNNYERIPIAVANIDLSKHEITNNKGYYSKLVRTVGTVREKSILLDLLNSCFYNRIKITKGDREKEEEKIPAKFLVFPEYYLPIEWLNIIARFSRKIGTTVVTGLKPIKLGKQVFNLQAIAVPFKDVYGHLESMVFIREKNNYAPLEKQIFKNSKSICCDAKVPTYFLFDNSKIKFASFVCYELTDVRARSLFKNEVDIIVSSEFNEDIYYFSNIVESSARDLNCFVVQVNSSNYGDSRIAAPYRDKYKEIVKITGGVKDSIHMGIVELKKFKEYMNEFRSCDSVCDYKKITPMNTPTTKKYKIFKKPSAGIK